MAYIDVTLLFCCFLFWVGPCMQIALIMQNEEGKKKDGCCLIEKIRRWGVLLLLREKGTCIDKALGIFVV